MKLCISLINDLIEADELLDDHGYPQANHPLLFQYWPVYIGEPNRIDCLGYLKSQTTWAIQDESEVIRAFSVTG